MSTLVAGAGSEAADADAGAAGLESEGAGAADAELGATTLDAAAVDESALDAASGVFSFGCALAAQE